MIITSSSANGGHIREFERKLLIEWIELAKKIDKLQNFMYGISFDVLDSEQKRLLKAQLCAMQHYSSALEERICSLMRKGRNVYKIEAGFESKKVDKDNSKMIN